MNSDQTSRIAKTTLLPFQPRHQQGVWKKRQNPLPKRRKDDLGDTFSVRILLQVFCQIDFTLN